MKSSEKWGEDTDTAVELALKDLKLTIEEVDVEVLEESSNGFLGIGSKLAKVRVTAKEDVSDNSQKEKAKFDDIDKILADLPENRAVEVPDEIREKYDKYEQEELEDAKASECLNSGRGEGSKRGKESYNNRRSDFSITGYIKSEIKNLERDDDHPIGKFLSEMAHNMGVDLEFKVMKGEDLIYIEITGQDTGTIIGKRGQTLDAVQYIAGLVVNKAGDKYVRVIIDAENYRAKREQTLINLANRLAGKVERTGRNVTLEPMNPYERKVIHSALQDNPYIKTRSEGSEPYRRVVIERN